MRARRRLKPVPASAREAACAVVKFWNKARLSALKYSTKNLPSPYMMSVAANTNIWLSIKNGMA